MQNLYRIFWLSGTTVYKYTFFRFSLEGLRALLSYITIIKYKTIYCSTLIPTTHSIIHAAKGYTMQTVTFLKFKYERFENDIKYNFLYTSFIDCEL